MEIQIFWQSNTVILFYFRKIVSKNNKYNPNQHIHLHSDQGLVKTLEERLGTKLVISDKSQLCGALGAALFATEM